MGLVTDFAISQRKDSPVSRLQTAHQRKKGLQPLTVRVAREIIKELI
jgi:hypothetical protein